MVFGVLLLIYEAMICALFSTVYGLSPEYTLISDFGGVLLASVLTILMILGIYILTVGFGLINGYVSNAGFSGILYTLIIYCITIQHFYIFRAFWNKAGANDVNSGKTYH